MVYGLSGSFAVIGNKTKISQVKFFGQITGGQQYFAQQFGVAVLRFRQTADVLLRNNQDMRGSLRVQILKSQYVIVFIDDLAFNGSASNVAKYTVHILIISYFSLLRKGEMKISFIHRRKSLVSQQSNASHFVTITTQKKGDNKSIAVTQGKHDNNNASVASNLVEKMEMFQSETGDLETAILDFNRGTSTASK